MPVNMQLVGNSSKNAPIHLDSLHAMPMSRPIIPNGSVNSIDMLGGKKVSMEKFPSDLAD